MIEILTSTRVQIMLKLRERPYTSSEISKITGFSKTAINYHLGKLVENGLVERVERGKWVYYKLTSKGYNKLRFEAIATLTSLTTAVLSTFTLITRLLISMTAEKRVPSYPTPMPAYIPKTLGETILTPEVILAFVAFIAFGIFFYFKLK
ncbi:MAG: winged helix-turn-helix domain-containing protein [Archaeoglobaceae archaeon]